MVCMQRHGYKIAGMVILLTVIVLNVLFQYSKGMEGMASDGKLPKTRFVPGFKLLISVDIIKYIFFRYNPARTFLLRDITIPILLYPTGIKSGVITTGHSQ